jgi:DNA-binding transcriptional regulator GbsR (MarR family)
VKLTPVTERFVVRWGEMGTVWGINRATAQIVALLYLSKDPLTAEEIGDLLSIARSTVSVDLRELQNWGVVRVVHVLGDRRDHFETLGDPADLFRAIARERRRREIDPLVQALRDGVAETGDADAFARDRMQRMLELFEILTAMHDRSEEMSTEMLVRMARQVSQVPGRMFLKIAQLGDGLGDALRGLVR